MRAGRLDRVVKILRDVETGRDAYNAPIIQTQVIATTRAEIIFKSEDEAFAASQRYATRTATFRIRWRSDIRSTDRLRCQGVVWEIKGQRELGRREGLELACEVTS